MPGRRPALLLAIVVQFLLAGCNRGSTAGRRLPYAPLTATEPTVVTKLEGLTTDREQEIHIELPFRSLAVMGRFDQMFGERGWRPIKARLQQPGQRVWLPINVDVTTVLAYDARWEDPKTGKSALLNIWYKEGDRNTQHGVFELYGPGKF